MLKYWEIWGIENDFCRWLKKRQRMIEGKCCSCVSDIRRAERFAQEHGLASQALYTKDAAEARTAADALFANAEFIRHMRSRDNSFLSAIKSLIKFYGLEWSRPAQGTDHSFDVAPQAATIDERFPNAQSLLDGVYRSCMAWQTEVGKGKGGGKYGKLSRCGTTSLTRSGL